MSIKYLTKIAIKNYIYRFFFKKMKKLKINIIYAFHLGAWGGANQFLSALRSELIKLDLYEDDPMKSDCFIFNSHHNFRDVIKMKLKKPNSIFVHRLAGPIYLTRKEHRLDKNIYKINRYVADGTIFQSEWSKKENFKYGFKKTSFIKTITNAVDKKFFFTSEDKKIKNWEVEKCKLINTSWSKNPNKGFKLYSLLDKSLDFSKYSMCLIGNSPIKFKNIQHIKPVESIVVAEFLRDSDIFITGAINEACSNSILEALASGLPCIAINNSSNPEIIKDGGELFNTNNDCLEKIAIVRKNYLKYFNNIKISDIEEITKRYLDFIESINRIKRGLLYNPKKLRLFDYFKIFLFYDKSVKEIIREIIKTFLSKLFLKKVI